VKKQLILIMLCLIAVLISVSTVSAASYYVNDTNGNDFTNTGGINDPFKTIYKGVSSATDGDTVNIAAGTYTGNNNKDIQIDKDITIQGAGQNQTIIDSSGTKAFTIASGTNVTITGLTIKNANGSAIMSSGGGENPTISINQCTFINNSWPGLDKYGGAISFIGTMTVNGCTFINNTAEYGGAIAAEGDVNIIGSLFTGNSAEYGGAIYNYEGIMNITGCNFYNNKATEHGAAVYGAWPESVSTTFIKYSRFVNNLVGTTQQDLYLENPIEAIDQVGAAQGESTMTATLNWWGDNNGPTATRVESRNSNIPIIYSPWLVMNIKADPTTINTGQTSTVKADVYTDSAGVNHSADAVQFFSGPEVTFTSQLGKIGSYTITVPWVLGQAVRTYHGVLAGVDHVTAADGVQVVSTPITVIQAPVANAASNTVGMQETGLPIAGLVLAVLALFGGLATSKRK